MLYEFTVYLERGNSKKKIFGSQINASNPINALERACIRFAPDRVVEIRLISDHGFTGRPHVAKIERNGVI